MQALRDAAILAVLGLILATVRVEPLPTPAWSGGPAKAAATPTTAMPAEATPLAATSVRPTVRMLEVAEPKASPTPAGHDDCTCHAEEFDLIELVGTGRELVVLIKDVAAEAPSLPDPPQVAFLGRDCT